VQALRYDGKAEEAIAYARETAALSPRMLSDRGYLRAVYDSVRTTKKPDDVLSAAKLFYVLCDYTERDIKEATELAAGALMAKGGPGASLQFAKSQEKPDAANPLKDAPMFALGESEKLLAAAGQDPDAQLNALLVAGRMPEALKVAVDQMRDSAGKTPAGIAQALRNIARCFKAHDLNLVRANRFLDFHRTGEGDNPLPAFEAELAKSGGAK